MKSIIIESATLTADYPSPTIPSKGTINPAAGPQMPCYANHLTTDEAAAFLHVQPQTLRKAFSQHGSYGGIVPRKSAFNRRLYWNADAVRRLVEGA